MKLFIWIPMLSALIALPLVFGQIPPNGFYGFRTLKTLSSAEVWYRANRLAGFDLLVASLVSIIATLFIHKGVASTHTALVYDVCCYSVLTLLAVGVALIQLRGL